MRRPGDTPPAAGGGRRRLTAAAGRPAAGAGGPPPIYDGQVSDDAYLLTGPRVGLRHLRDKDMAEFTERARESVEFHHPWVALPARPEDFTAYRQRFGEPDREGFVLCERDTGGIAGGAAVNNIVRGAFQSGALGYGAFVHAAGRGLMAEGLRLLLRHAFGELGLHRIEANVQPGNEPSLRLVRRLGFRREGLSPDFLFINGAWRDHERWAITTEMTRN